MAAQTLNSGTTLIGNTQVPNQYVSEVNAAASALGIPAAVVASQINEESGFQPDVTSPTGAQGIAQFEPGTWSQYGSGSAYDATDAFTAYTKYMGVLLKQESGSVFDALEAYNAGPGNLKAGSGYAQTIMSNAGLFDTLKQGATGALPAAPNAATEGGQGAAGTATTEGSWTSALGTVYQDVTSGLSIWPASFLAAVGDLDTIVSDVYKHAKLFFQPSTYVRIGSGVLGTICLAVALVMMVKEAKQ